MLLKIQKSQNKTRKEAALEQSLRCGLILVPDAHVKKKTPQSLLQSFPFSMLSIRLKSMLNP